MTRIKGWEKKELARIRRKVKDFTLNVVVFGFIIVVAVSVCGLAIAGFLFMIGALE